ncbi:MAG: TetR/AcrR family transcriptional regulator [Gammaproteobacteria bacterium]
MPKRTEAYMADQRAKIARSALGVLLKKGLHATSLRDVCAASGVSMGALYTHFETKDELVAAACASSFLGDNPVPLPETWSNYLEQLLEEPTPQNMRRFRLSLQVTAELSQADQSPELIDAIYFTSRSWIRSCLSSLQSKGVLELPHGLEATAEAHLQIASGAAYLLASDRNLEWEAAFATFALCAGTLVQFVNAEDGRRSGDKLQGAESQ